jgi:hypothetical protein
MDGAIPDPQEQCLTPTSDPMMVGISVTRPRLRQQSESAITDTSGQGNT